MNKDVLTAYPQLSAASLAPVLEALIQESPHKIIVLDDDPTGTQTVHDVSVYTGWDYDSVRQGFLEPQKLFYILTNSRSFSPEQTERIHREIAQTIEKVSQETGRDYLIISRSDSTLRGHYPLETETLRNVYETMRGAQVDGEILCFFFKEGGRYTLNDTHYVADGEKLIPAAETEFAKDSTFGYSHSSLPDYIEEKTGGAYRAKDVISIPLEMLRNQEISQIEELLMGARDFNKIVVNTIDYCDLMVFCTALYRAIARGKHFLMRSAASLVKVLGGISDIPLLEKKDLLTSASENGGLVVVGSYTNKTTQQLEALRTLDHLEFFEFNSDLVLTPELLEQETARMIAQAEACIAQGTTAVVYTKRKLLTQDHDTRESVLARSTKISEAVQSIVAGIQTEPSFILAKGGITSSDICTKALKVRHGTVLGQAAPGVPVIRTDSSSKFPGIPYIIFPGNVGDEYSLRRILNLFA